LVTVLSIEIGFVVGGWLAFAHQATGSCPVDVTDRDRCIDELLVQKPCAANRAVAAKFME